MAYKLPATKAEVLAASPGFLWWREFVMQLGMACLFLAGLIAGPAYANRVLTETFDSDD